MTTTGIYILYEGSGEEAYHRLLSELATATALYDEVDLPLFAAASRRRRGELLGGDAGRAEPASADTFLRSPGLVNPVRYTAILLPG